MNAENHIIILHISDLHRSPTEPLTNADLWQSLWRDIRVGYSATNRGLRNDEPKLPKPEDFDLVIVSGDLTRRAARTEYVEVAGFLKTIVDELLQGDRTRLIITPGNHDIDWDLCRGAYREVIAPARGDIDSARFQESDFRLAERETPLNLALMKLERHDLYADRLREFARFTGEFYKKRVTFPTKDRSGQWLIFDRFAEQLGVVVVSFNSCDKCDHLWRRGSIHREAILMASQELDRQYDPVSGPMRIAVWHHNVLGSPKQSDFLDPRVPLMLADHGFVLGLHGHVHEAGHFELIGPLARIPIVWSGSLAAGSRDRPASTPLLYNVIGIDTVRRKGWVHVRARKDPWKAWSASHDWSPRHRCWYAIRFPAPPGAVEPVEHRVYRNIYDTVLVEELESLLLQARELTVVAAAGLIVQGNFRDIAIRRSKAGELNATLCYANPFSEKVLTRLVEEETGRTMPDIGREGIVRRVKVLLKAAKDTENIRVRLFNGYPTMSIIRMDNRYVYYPLGYRTIGSLCPAVWEDGTSLFGQFLESEINLYLDDSVDAAEVFQEKGLLG